MNRYSLTRPALVSGILYSVLQAAVLVYFAVLVFPGLGPVEAPAEQRARAYAELADVLRLGNYLIMLPAPFFLVFLGGAAGALGSATGADRVLSTVTVAAGTIMAMLWPLAAVISDIGVLSALAGGDAATIAAMDAVGPYMLALSALPRAVLLVGLSLTLTDRAGPSRWAAWAGYGLAALSVVGSATLVNDQLFPVLALGTLLFELWVVVVCAVLWRPAGHRAALADHRLQPGL